MSAGARPTVVVVDADPAVRRLVRLGLEIDGARVVECTCARDARHVLARTKPGDAVRGVVIAPHLPDADGLELAGEIERVCPGVPVVVMAGHGEALDAGGPMRVVRGDVDALVSALALPATVPGHPALVAVELLRDGAEQLADEWRELCRWDPMLAPDTQPPIAAAVITAVADALSRPQPLGWGPDPEIEKVAEVFAVAVGALEPAVGQLVCLREALRRALEHRLPADEEVETMNRLNMAIDRAIAVTARRLAERLEQQAYVDVLTGLLNRRAMDRDLRREMGRAARYGRRFTVMMVDLDGLKAVNDTQGHAAGDTLLRSLAGAVRDALRIGDAAYRIGGDEFVLLLPETEQATTAAVAARIDRSGAPRFTWGSATFPDDGDDVDALLEIADRRLLVKRATRA